MDDLLRWDVLSGGWVAVVARRKGASPLRRTPGELPRVGGRCPFCPGNESDTDETLAADPPEGPWRVRVVRNLYPLVTPAAAREAIASGFVGEPARGAHEVLVESPEHDSDLPDFSPEQAVRVLRMYRDRVAALRGVEGIRSVVVFRNRGRRAGSSQPHPHGQLVASEVVGPAQRARDRAARQHHEERGTRLLDTVIERELEAGERVIEEAGPWVAFCPWAPHTPYQTLVAPRQSGAPFTGLADDALESLADLLQRTLRRVRHASGNAAYNLVLRLPPVHHVGAPHAFWLFDVMPRRGGAAGFELSTGIDIVTLPPERAAEEIRAAPG